MFGTYAPTKGFARVAISQKTIPKLKDNISESKRFFFLHPRNPPPPDPPTKKIHLAKWRHLVSNRFCVINLDHFKGNDAHSQWLTAVTCISHTPCCRHGGCFPVSGGGRSTASGSLCPPPTFSSTTQSLETQNLPAEKKTMLRHHSALPATF